MPMLRAPAAFALATAATVGIAVAPFAIGQEMDPMSGPTVPEHLTRPSLVHRDMQGRLITLEVRPEIAAIELLELEGESLARVREVLNERAAVMDDVLRTNFETLIKIEPAFNAGEFFKGLGYIRDLLVAFQAEYGESPLVDRITETLPAMVRDQYARLVEEYYDALLEQKLIEEDAPEKGLGRRIQAGIQKRAIQGEMFFLEVERSVERLDSDNDDGEEFINLLMIALDMPDEKEAEVRQRILDFVFKRGLDLDKDQERQLLLMVHDAIGPEYHRRYFEFIISLDDGSE